MLSALLILMIGFVGGVAVTVTLGVGLYFMVTKEDEEFDTKSWTPPSPMKPSASPQAPASAGYGAFPPRLAASPQLRPSSVELDDWRY